MSYTQATVIIAAADQAAAQVDFPGSFNAEFTDGQNTVYVCSGLWDSADLSKLVNDLTWPCKVYFEDPQTVLANLGLTPVAAPME